MKTGHFNLPTTQSDNVRVKSFHLVNALELTGLANLRVVGKPYLIG
jgi:hypothetical protein